MSAEITAFKDHQSFKLYINKLLHLEIRNSNHDGVQSWYEGNTDAKVYCIEFYRKKGKAIQLQYDEFEVWKKILELIDANI